MSVSFLACFQVLSNRLLAHTKQEKGHFVKTRSNQGFNLYNIERENPFEGRFFSLQGCKESRNPFASEWEVWKRFLQSVVNFFKCGELVFKFLKVLSFKVKVFGREFFELSRISTLKFF